MNEILKRDNLSTTELLSVLKSINDLENIYQCQVRQYTLEKHTLLVLSEYGKYFSNVTLPIEKSLFKVMLALHDIGKPKAFSEGNRNKQYLYTNKLIGGVRNQLPFSTLEIDLCIALVKSDPIGMYMQNQINIENAKNQIEELSKQTFLNKVEFFKLMVIYYQCDTASYTVDAGGLAFLEHLYEYKNNIKTFNNENMRLKFSTLYENKYLELEKALFI